MNAETITEAVDWTEMEDRARMVHLVCDCDEDTALCGEDVSDRDFTEEDPECAECIELAGKPCGVPGCPFSAKGLRRLYFRMRGWL